MADRAPLLPVAVALMAGIVVGDSLPMSASLLYVFLITVGISLLARKHRRIQSAALLLCMAVLGALLMTLRRQQLNVAWPDGRQTYEAVVVSEPQEKPKTVAVDLLLPKSGQKIKAYIHTDERSRQLTIGDGLAVCTQVEMPTSPPMSSASRVSASSTGRTFDYRRYLLVHGFTGTAYIGARQWQGCRVSLKNVPMVERSRLFFLRQRHHLLQRYRTEGAADEQYAVLAAMTLGDKTALSHELREVYSITGASHVLALSGLHLGIIYSLLALLVVGRRWRIVSQTLVILAIWSFVLLVGLPPSVVRAAVMLTVYALLALGGRRRMSVSTLAFTAICMLIVDPFSLYDVGFQLSFLAVFSILLWMPVAEQIVSPAWLQRHTLLRWLWTLMAVSVAAQIGVAPLLAYYFGRFSCYFLLTNLLVIPAATAILYLALGSLLLPLLSGWLLAVVGIMNAVLVRLSCLPGASISIHPSAIQVVLTYVIVGALYALTPYFLKERIREPET